MSTIPVAVQLYSVHDECVQDLPGVLKQVAGLGYSGVEFAGFHGNDPADIKQQLDDLGLAPVSSHVQLAALLGDEFDRTVEMHQQVGCDHLIVPWLGEEYIGSAELCKKTAATMVDVLGRLKPLGMRTGFHNHAQDMRPTDSSDSPWDIIAQHTPDEFILQYDTANGMDGGADPVAPIRQYPGRGVTIHLKEFHADAEHGHGQGAIGTGSVPWADVFAAAQEAGGTTWYIVEQEGHPELSPMEAIGACRENLKGMGV